MRHVPYALALAGLFWLSACNSPHLTAENASLRAQIKERDKLLAGLEDVIHKGEANATKLFGKIQDAEHKLTVAEGEWAEKERQLTRKIAQLEDDLSVATGKKNPSIPAGEAPKDSAQPKKAETKSPDRGDSEKRPSENGKTVEGKKAKAP